MGNYSVNADSLLQHYGTRDATGEHKYGEETGIGLVILYDDFLYSGAFEAASPWVLNSGADTQAIDPAVNAQAGGVVRLTTGNADGTTANDASGMVGFHPWTADMGGLVFECRLKCVTNTDTMSINAGFTDVTGLEEPFSISGTTITSTASDAVCFVYDTAQTTDSWYCCGVAGDTDATGNAIVASTAVNADGTSIAAPSTSWQTLRIEVGQDGSTAKFSIDGVTVGTLTANAVTASTAIYPTIIANATTTTSKSVDVDYVLVAAQSSREPR